MSDFARLEEKLEKLRKRERSPGEKRVFRGSVDRLIAAVVTEVDETVLPRRLTFSTDAGAEIHIAVANRKLQALVSPAPSVDGAASLADAALKDVEDPGVAQLKDIFARALTGSETLKVSISKFSSQTFPSDVGVPSALLARAWDIVQADIASEAEEAVNTFVSSNLVGVTAWIRIEGEEIADRGGDSGSLARITEQAAIFLDGYFNAEDQIFLGEEGPVALVLASDSSSEALVFVHSGNSVAFLLCSAASAAELATSWQNSILV